MFDRSEYPMIEIRSQKNLWDMKTEKKILNILKDFRNTILMNCPPPGSR
jgi:hypothetical protein